LDKKLFNHEGHEDHEGKIIEKTSCPSCASWLISSGSGSARLGLTQFEDLTGFRRRFQAIFAPDSIGVHQK
jgi:hypothetical protein